VPPFRLAIRVHDLYLYMLHASTNCASYTLTTTLSQRARGMQEIAIFDRAQYT